jgi:hypothetical protein
VPINVFNDWNHDLAEAKASRELVDWMLHPFDRKNARGQQKSFNT